MNVGIPKEITCKKLMNFWIFFRQKADLAGKNSVSVHYLAIIETLPAKSTWLKSFKNYSWTTVQMWKTCLNDNIVLYRSVYYPSKLPVFFIICLNNFYYFFIICIVSLALSVLHCKQKISFDLSYKSSLLQALGVKINTYNVVWTLYTE